MSVRKIINRLLDFIFPDKDIVREMKSMSADEIQRLCIKKKDCRYKNVETIFSYKDPRVKNMIWQIKFNGDRDIAVIFGTILYEKIIKKINIKEKYVLIPVPIHRRRRSERGFNQCEWLCEEIIKNDAEKIFIYKPKVASRIIYKNKQSWNDKIGRQKNIIGVFKINNKKELIGRNIIIIDDVITTGSTLRELMSVIERCSPKSVKSFTIAN